MTRNLPIRVVVRQNIQNAAIRRESMKIRAKLARSPKLPPKNSLSSWRRVDSQKSMGLLLSFRQYMDHQRALRTAVSEERWYSQALVKIRMGQYFALR